MGSSPGLSFVLPLAGGLVIGLACLGLLVLNGRIAGITGIVGGLLQPASRDIAWRVAFLVGLLVGAAVMLWALPTAYPGNLVRSPAAMVVAGLLVGFGTRLGNGCTGGHGVCGIGRLSPRSLAATCVFIAAGAGAVLVIDGVFGGVL